MGWLWIVAGDEGSGKSWHTNNRVLRGQVHQRRCVISYSPEADDRIEYGPALTPARLRLLEHTPLAFSLVGCGPAEAIRIGMAAADRWDTVLGLHEAHELFPSRQSEGRSTLTVEERREVRALGSILVNRARHPHPHHLSLVLASQSYTGIDVEVRSRAAGVDFFHSEARRDLEVLRAHYGAGAALQIFRLPTREYVRVAKGHPLPAGWTGYVESLERAAKGGG